ncbi:MAG: asparagine synthetase family, partial [Acidobacteria bacterium]|nr:asparagine synthetase family [Acidobacteriota bacterium]
MHGSIRHWPLPAVTMPGSIAADNLLVSFEGRIDNRNELLRQWSLPAGSGDAAIVAACYRASGAGFPSAILGDFCFALWDGHSRLLMLGRDCFGIYPLYYRRTDDGIVWSSHLGALAHGAGGHSRPDPQFIAGFLTFGRRGDVTPFASIAGVPPASVVSFTSDRVSVDRYWQLDPENQVRLSSDSEYEEQFLALFRDSVRHRLRSDSPVFCELSGGVDSSSIVGVADEICRGDTSAHDHLQTISLIYAEEATFDDRPYIDIIEQAFGRTAHHAFEEQARLLASLEDGYSLDELSPLWVGAGLIEAEKQQIASAGSNVLLSGIGGDHLCWSEFVNPPAVADDLARLRLRSAFRESKQWATVLGKPRSGILIGAAYEVFGRAETSMPPWLDRRFAKATGIDRPLRGDPEIEAFRLPSRRAHFIALRSLAAEIGIRRGIFGPVDVRYPFLERRLVEFAFAIPLEQHIRPGENRSLQRRSMARIVPRGIAYRRTKGGPAGTIYRRFRQRWPAIKTLFQDARVCADGYVDRAVLTDSLERAAHGQNRSAPGLLRLIALESWLRK